MHGSEQISRVVVLTRGVNQPSLPCNTRAVPSVVRSHVKKGFVFCPGSCFLATDPISPSASYLPATLTDFYLHVRMLHIVGKQPTLPLCVPVMCYWDGWVGWWVVIPPTPHMSMFDWVGKIIASMSAVWLQICSHPVVRTEVSHRMIVPACLLLQFPPTASGG